jgi:DNA-binding beta-propeller fold protein YncE
MLASCAMAPPEDQVQVDIVFPPPPEQARFIFERTIHGSADIKTVDNETRWRRILTGEAATSQGLAKPFDVEACQGRIYVSDSVARSVFLFDVPGGEFSEIGVREPGLLQKPLGMATDEECNLYVADGSLRTVVVFDQDGRFITRIGGIEMFDRLSYVEVDPAGDRIYAVDTGGVGSDRHHVRVFDVHSGEHLYDIGSRGSEPGELNLARDIAMGADGNLYVVDGGNFRVQVFDLDGNFIRQIGAIGVRTGQFSRPKGIDTDGEGNVYVSDAAFGNFQIFNADGELLLFIGDRSETLGPAKFMLPAGLAVDEDGRVYMVDQFFRKVDVFRPASMSASEGYLGARTQSLQ